METIPALINTLKLHIMEKNMQNSLSLTPVLIIFRTKCGVANEINAAWPVFNKLEGIEF